MSSARPSGGRVAKIVIYSTLDYGAGASKTVSGRQFVLPGRATDVYAQSVGDEIVVVNSATQQAHALSGLVADVWRASETGAWRGPVTEELHEAVDRLIKRQLLISPRGLSRRRILQGVGAATVVGGLASIGLPALDAAASPGNTVEFTNPAANPHTLTIPAGTHVIDFTVVGAGGGGGAGALNTTIVTNGGAGGNAGTTTGTITVTGPTTLTVVIGAGGAAG